MSPTDFLTILGLALAAWAIIDYKERQFILLFFSRAEFLIGIFLLGYIHFLLAFDWLMENWFPSLQYFTIPKGIPAVIWAYIVALAVIVYPIVKIKFGYFAKGRLDNLLTLYRALIDQNQIDLLVNYISKYHLNDIELFLRDYSNLPERETIDILLRKKTETDVLYEQITSKKHALFAAAVYNSIITDEAFIQKAAHPYPELFAQVIKGMQNPRAANSDFVQLYVRCLFENKNQKLINELKVLNGARDSIKDRVRYVDLPIMEGLMVNTKVAAENYVWYPVGQEVMKSMKYDEDQLIFLKRPYDDHLENELWQQKIYIAIVYFNYMVRETIYRDSEWHMWLFYYLYFVKELINNIQDQNVNDITEYSSFNHFLIKEIIDNIEGWLRLNADQNSEDRYIDSLKCLGKILLEITNANDNKLSPRLKATFFKSIITEYFRLSEHENIEISNAIRTYIEGMFRNPGNPDWHEIQASETYCLVLKQAWQDFDKVPYEGMEDNGSLSRFEQNVLNPLNLL